MTDFAIEFLGGVPDVNFLKGREGNPVSMLVDHWIGAGTLDSAVRYFQTPRPINPTSAHFIVGTTGRIVGLVNVFDTAFHAGDFDVNLQSVGIEHECHPTLPPSDMLYRASGWLHRHLAEFFEISLQVGVTMLPHRKVSPTTCPGTLDLDRIWREATSMTDEEFEAKFLELTKKHIAPTLQAMKNAYDPWAHHTHDTTEPK